MLPAMLPTASSPSEVVFVIGAGNQPAAAPASAGRQNVSQHARDLLTEVEYGPAIALAIAKTQTLLEVDSASICLVENGGVAVQHLVGEERDSAGAAHGGGFSYPRLPENDVLQRRGACAACRLQPPAWCVSAPLYSEGQQIGMLCAMRKTPRPRFKLAQIDLLQQLAFWSAIAIANARKVRAMQEQARSEREHIAAHLHDNAAQNLSAISLKIEQVEAALGPALPDAVRGELQAVRTISGQLSAQVRAAFGDLRQPPEQAGDLVTALADSIDVFTRATRLPVEFSVTGVCALPAAAQAQAALIVREALNNVAQHAQAGSVQVKLLGDRRSLRIVVQDDGRGFDPRITGADPHHLGTQLMRERAQRSGGALAIESQPGHGARVTLVYAAPGQP
jgi:signal transduction histidine kinase